METQQAGIDLARDQLQHGGGGGLFIPQPSRGKVRDKDTIAPGKGSIRRRAEVRSGLQMYRVLAQTILTSG